MQYQKITACQFLLAEFDIDSSANRVSSVLTQDMEHKLLLKLVSLASKTSVTIREIFICRGQSKNTFTRLQMFSTLITRLTVI